MAEKDVDPDRAKLDRLWVRIGGSVGYMVYISPEWMVEQWNFWKHEHKRTVKGGSQLTRYLGIEIAKLMAIDMYSYWHTQKCLGGASYSGIGTRAGISEEDPALLLSGFDRPQKHGGAFAVFP